MSYLLDRQIKRKKIISFAILIGVLIILFYFRVAVFQGLSSVAHAIFKPVLVFRDSVSNKFSNNSSFFKSKKSLLEENRKLQLELDEMSAKLSSYDSVAQENVQIKEILGRKAERTDMVLASILSKPNQSPYGTLVVDAGIDQDVSVGNIVFALGNIPIGRVAEVYKSSSKIILFSTPGEKTEAVLPVKDIFMELVGRGTGNFEMILLRDLELAEGSGVVLPGINAYLLATVEKIISDPRESFKKALLVSPVNIQELKFVQVQK